MYSRLEQSGVASGEVTPKLSYLICGTPRSGSTLLSEALTETGIAGCPQEHFEALLETGRPRRPRDYFARANDPDVIALLDDPKFSSLFGDDELEGNNGEAPSVEDLLEQAIREGTTSNGIFGKDHVGLLS